MLVLIIFLASLIYIWHPQQTQGASKRTPPLQHTSSMSNKICCGNLTVSCIHPSRVGDFYPKRWKESIGEVLQEGRGGACVPQPRCRGTEVQYSTARLLSELLIDRPAACWSMREYAVAPLRFSTAAAAAAPLLMYHCWRAAAGVQLLVYCCSCTAAGALLLECRSWYTAAGAPLLEIMLS